MAHNTFISYKYSESKELRDRIIKKLGNDARYYKGEKGYSKDLTGYAAETIKKYLSDMIFNTSVTIVILSPNMLFSNWMEWEIGYSLRNISRGNQSSRPNGIVCVVKKDQYYGYNWFRNCFGEWAIDRTFNLINKNRENKCFDFLGLSNNYIDIVTEDDFLRNYDKYIEDAYNKSIHSELYNIRCNLN